MASPNDEHIALSIGATVEPSFQTGINKANAEVEKMEGNVKKLDKQLRALQTTTGKQANGKGGRAALAVMGEKDHTSQIEKKTRALKALEAATNQAAKSEAKASRQRDARGRYMGPGGGGPPISPGGGGNRWQRYADGMGKNNMRSSSLAMGLSGVAAYGGIQSINSNSGPGLALSKAMASLRARSGLNDQESKQMENLALHQKGVSGVESAGAMAELAASGWTKEDLQKGFSDTVTLAKASQTDLKSAADLATNIMLPFGKAPKDMKAFSDTLVTVSEGTSLSFGEIAQSMTYVAGSAAGLGMTIEETSTLLGALGEAGIKGSRGGTSLGAIIDAIATPQGAGLGRLKQLGVETKGRKDIGAVLGEINSSIATNGLEGDKVQILDDIFGTIGGRAVNSMFASGGQGLKVKAKLDALMLTKEGRTQGMADKQTAHLGHQMDLIGVSFTNIKSKIFRELEPALTKLITPLAGIANWLAESLDKWPALGIVVGTLALGLSGLFAVVGTAASLFFALSTATEVLQAAFMLLAERTAASAALQGAGGAAGGAAGAAGRGAMRGLSAWLGKAAIVVGVAVVGWQIGKAIGDSLEIDDKIGDYVGEKIFGKAFVYANKVNDTINMLGRQRKDAGQVNFGTDKESQKARARQLGEVASQRKKVGDELKAEGVRKTDWIPFNEQMSSAEVDTKTQEHQVLLRREASLFAMMGRVKAGKDPLETSSGSRMKLQATVQNPETTENDRALATAMLNRMENEMLANGSLKGGSYKAETTVNVSVANPNASPEAVGAAVKSAMDTHAGAEASRWQNAFDDGTDAW